MSIIAKDSRIEFTAPKHSPCAGDVYVAERTFTTGAGEIYYRGDKIYIIERTYLNPHQVRSSRGNWLIRGKDGKVTVWATLEYSVSRDLFKLAETSNA